jgi:hypothetical protein
VGTISILLANIEGVRLHIDYFFNAHILTVDNQKLNLNNFQLDNPLLPLPRRGITLNDEKNKFFLL